MAIPETVEELSQLVRDQIMEVLQQRGGVPFTLESADKLEKLDSQLQAILADKSAARILQGPLWLSGASIINSTVTADKLIVNTLEAVTTNTGNINVTGNITAAASYPALTGARVVINSTEIAGYNASDAKTFQLHRDGSGFIGIGSSKVSWTTLGVVTVPVAAIGSLTIADIGSGSFNNNFDAGTGRIRAGTALQRVEITSAGLAAYNTAGTQTFLLSASDGSLTHTGVHTIRNSATGARVELSNVGLRGFNSGGTQTFGISTSDGSGFLGAGTPVTWNSSGTVTIDGSLLVSGTVTAGKLNVSTLSAISANLGTITAGSINAATVTVSNLTATNISSGALGSGGSGIAIGGTNGLSINGTLTINTGGSIANSSGSTWDTSVLTLRGTGTSNSAIIFKTSTGTTRAYLVTDSNGPWFAYHDGTTAGGGIAGYSSKLSLFDAGTETAKLESGNFYTRRLYPGVGSSGLRSTYYIDAESIISNGIGIGGMLGISSGNTINFVSPGTGGSASNWSSFTTANIPDKSAGYFIIQIGGTNYRVPFYAHG